ncbi:MAG: hypothetical protein ACIAS6_12590 [Phycisphaerales bacterium JB060]
MKNFPRIGPLLAAGLVVCTLSLLACEAEQDEAPAAPDARYTTQGRVYSLPDPASPASEFKIHHEAIPNFVNGQGEVVGMNSHPMSFPRVAEGIDIDSLEVGQPVRFTFDVTWGEAAPTWTITELERLPDDTWFAFEADPAEPQSDTGDPDATPDSSGS